MPNKRRILVLLVLACLAVVGTLFQTYRFDQRLAANRGLEDAAAQQLTATELGLGDLRQSQAGYVAAGQSADFWMSRFDEAITRVEGTLRERQQITQSSGALAHYDAAIEQLQALVTSDRRARNYVEIGQLILASDVIFVESLEILGRISANVAAARDTEVFEARQSTAAITQYRQALAAGGVLFTLLVAMLAYRNIGATSSEEPVGGRAVAPDAQKPGTAVEEPAAVVAASGAAGPRLGDTADICVDMARLLDGRDLPALLGRASEAIGAKGLVLWVADDQKTALRATLGYGYSDRTLQRLGTLAVSADNVTSLACRTLQPQFVPAASPEGAGAIAVPLIGTTGCVGVLAVEVAGMTTAGDHVAIARVIAAQLSAVISPPPSAEQTANAR